MDLTLTPKVLAEFRDKDSRIERFRSLYERRPFLEAYAMHTDLRVADNPKGGIGREDEWESHGKLQLDFLRSEGLLPRHMLLDVGCGVGRLARKVVPYLERGNYTGVDISPAALHYAQALAEREGWIVHDPVFLLSGDLKLDGPFDMLWGHSVFTHLPPQQIETMIRNAATLLSAGARFLFTYKRAHTVQRSGLKQFQYPPVYFAALAARYGFRAEPLAFVFPAHQSTMRLTRLETDE